MRKNIRHENIRIGNVQATKKEINILRNSNIKKNDHKTENIIGRLLLF